MKSGPHFNVVRDATFIKTKNNRQLNDKNTGLPNAIFAVVTIEYPQHSGGSCTVQIFPITCETTFLHRNMRVNILTV
jgi:hypothetical protein